MSLIHDTRSITPSPITVQVAAGAIWIGPVEEVRRVHASGLPGERDEAPPPVLLEVNGGVLIWRWLRDAGDALDLPATLAQAPLAVIEDLDAAQEWLWALYGSAIAVAADSAATTPITEAAAPELTWAPGLPGLSDRAARAGFGLWLAAWWPASTLDDQPALDVAVLSAEIAELLAELDGVLDPEMVPLPALSPAAPTRYAVAAGADEGEAARLGSVTWLGHCGARWADLPAGWVDASQRAITWRIEHNLTGWTARVRVAAGPRPPLGSATLHAVIDEQPLTLHLTRDDLGQCWLGQQSGTAPLSPPDRIPIWWAPTQRAPGPIPDWQGAVRDLARSRQVPQAQVPLFRAEREAYGHEDL